MNRIKTIPQTALRTGKLTRLLDLLPYALFLFVALTGAILLVYDMKYGPWAYSDSAEYIDSARNLVKGIGLGITMPGGYFSPLTLHPPLYPLLLAPFLAFGADPFGTIVVLNIVFFALSLLLIGAGTYGLTQSFGWSVSVTVMTLVSVSVLRLFDGAMSEPPYVLFTLASIYLLVLYRRDRKTKIWVWSAFLAAAAALTRFIGAVSLVLGFLALLFDAGPVRQRLKRAFSYAIISALPLGLWLLPGLLNGGRAAGRVVQANANLLAMANEYRKIITEILVTWIPYQYRLPTWSYKTLALYAIAAGTLALFLLALWARRRAKNANVISGLDEGLALMVLSAVYVVGYLAFLGISFLFSSVQPDIIDRTISPIFPLLLILVFGGFFLVIRAMKWPALLQLIPLLLFLLSYRTYKPVAWSYLQDRNEKGTGYTAAAWHQSEIIHFIDDLPSGTPLISNESAAVLLYAGRFPYDLSEVKNGVALEGFPAYGAGGSKDEQLFREECAVLVLIEPWLTAQLSPLYGDQTAARIEALTIGLQVVQLYDDGGMYVYPGCAVPSLSTNGN